MGACPADPAEAATHGTLRATGADARAEAPDARQLEPGVSARGVGCGGIFHHGQEKVVALDVFGGRAVDLTAGYARVYTGISASFHRDVVELIMIAKHAKLDQ